MLPMITCTVDSDSSPKPWAGLTLTIPLGKMIEWQHKCQAKGFTSEVKRKVCGELDTRALVAEAQQDGILSP